METDIRYPIGKFVRTQTLTAQERSDAIAVLAAFPQALRTVVGGWNDAQLDTPYREGGWTARQVVHHLADSHLQAVARTRMALTEDWPVITAYNEAAWAELEDARTQPVGPSLQLLEAAHARWVALLGTLDEKQWDGCGFKHPQYGPQSLAQVAALYAWHSRHHMAHLTGMHGRMER
ncbi:MAG: YfiT family bacillithiol transferase [Acidobacteriaceae bacterium]